MKKIIIITLGIIFVLVCVGVTGYLFFREKKDPITYQTESPVIMNIIKKTVATGSIEPRREVLVKPQVSGIIEEIYLKAGEEVKKGDVIAKVRIIPEMTRINDAESQLNTAKINLEISEKEYIRQQKLLNDKVISQREFVQFEQDYRIRKEQLIQAENNIQLIKKGSSDRIKNTTTEIKATIDGKILDIPIKVGSNVIQANNFNEGTTIASLANMDDLIFKGKLVESEIGKLSLNMNLDLVIAAIPDKIYKAKLEFIASKGVEDKGSIQFEIKAGILPSENNKLIRAGYSANADIILDKKDSVLSIREKNIEFKGDSAFVYLEKSPQTFEKRLIKTGLSDDLNIQIINGISTLDKIKVLITTVSGK
ncbi:MAG: efflux RND transporter periplasmic adaptor subunit [Bacteroidota bacterium]|nr:efflux RND transporter periplasmic adaptor subunit [Bacteroidota bacterium]